MKKLLLLSILMACSVLSFAAITRIELSKALANNMVSLKATATNNGYNGRGLKLELTNKGGSALMVTMDQAVILEPDSNGYQPLILAGEEMLVLQPFKSNSVEVQTFCGYSSRRAPYEQLSYTYDHVGSDTLKALLLYIKQNHLFDGLGQSAVWVLTNDHSLNNVYDHSREAQSKKLIAFLASLTGKSLPTYYISTDNSNTPGETAYNPKPLKIYASFEQKITDVKTLTLGVYDSQGILRQPVFQNKTFGKGGHRFKVEFEAKDVPPGKYYIRLMEEDVVLEETEVVVN